MRVPCFWPFHKGNQQENLFLFGGGSRNKRQHLPGDRVAIPSIGCDLRSSTSLAGVLVRDIGDRWKQSDFPLNPEVSQTGFILHVHVAPVPITVYNSDSGSRAAVSEPIQGICSLASVAATTFSIAQSCILTSKSRPLPPRAAERGLLVFGISRLGGTLGTSSRAQNH